MHMYSERRSGTDRRQTRSFAAFAHGSERRWEGASPCATTNAPNTPDDPFDPRDPYWEPVKGQDDD